MVKFQPLENFSTQKESTMKTIENIKFMLALVLAVFAFGFTVEAQIVKFRPLDASEAARWGATHVATLVEGDLTDTNLATLSAQTVTNGYIAANSVVIPVALTVGQAFGVNAASTNAYNYTTVSVGDSASATTFFPAVQVNGSGTNSVVVLPSFQTATYTNTVPNFVAFTNAPGKTFTAANYIRFTATAMTNQTLNSLTQGRVDAYFKVLAP